MSVLLYVGGAILLMLGVGAVGYGIPINEFSFGNTLIISGTTAAIGGLIIMALGVAVRQLQLIFEGLTAQTPPRPSRPDLFERPAGPTQVPARVPFPPRTKSAVPAAEPAPPADVGSPAPVEEVAAPVLPNPDLPVATAAEAAEVSLSPEPPPPASEPAARSPGPPPVRKRPESDAEPPRRGPPQATRNSYFDAMWPAESKPAKPPAVEEAKPVLPPAPAPEAPKPAEPPVAILKSGVVDGMAYTLYVDGSIEAELPQGTLHFASINELRSHLAQNT